MVLKVELDNNVWSFFPGQTISGRVVVTKNIWHKVEGLSIRFLGKIQIGCSASAPVSIPHDALPQSNHQQDGLLDRITKSRIAHEVVLDNKMNLLHSWKVLKPGSHEFPFTYELPEDDNLPESIKIDGCRVIYEFVVVLRRPRDDYKVYQTPFYVQTRISESIGEAIGDSSNSFEKKTENTIGFYMCCKSGPYGMLFRLPRKISWVGQDLDFVLEMWNDTTIDMDCAKVQLVREFKHKKGLETKRKAIVSELAGPAVASGRHEVWASYFRIPANTPPTNFIRRETYEINYTLKALIHPLNQSGKTVSIKCPVMVIRGVEIPSNVLGGADTTSMNTGSVALHPPPTYEEAIVGFDTTSTAPLFE